MPQMTVEEAIHTSTLPADYPSGVECVPKRMLMQGLRVLAAEYGRPHQRLLRLLEARASWALRFRVANDGDVLSGAAGVGAKLHAHQLDYTQKSGDSLDEAAQKVIDELDPKRMTEPRRIRKPPED